MKVIRTFKQYRELQIIEFQVNFCFQQIFLPTLLVTCLFIAIAGLFICIKLPDQMLESPIMAMAPLGLFNSFVILIVSCSVAAEVRTKSLDLVREMKNKISKTRQKNWVRKMAKSCPPLGIRNCPSFVEKITPILNLHFCIDQTAALLIAFE